MNAKRRNNNRDTADKLKAKVARKKAREALSEKQRKERMKQKKEWR